MLRRLYNYIRFGKITSRTTDTINGIPCEVEYYDRNGTCVGYWAYGSWHPDYPYKGE